MEIQRQSIPICQSETGLKLRLATVGATVWWAGNSLLLFYGIHNEHLCSMGCQKERSRKLFVVNKCLKVLNVWKADVFQPAKPLLGLFLADHNLVRLLLFLLFNLVSSLTTVSIFCHTGKSTYWHTNTSLFTNVLFVYLCESYAESKIIR